MIRKPQRKSYRVEYWFCGDPTCNKHATEAIAWRCIESRKRKRKPKWNKERMMQVLQERRAGATYEQLASAYKLSTTRMRQIVSYALWDEQSDIDAKDEAIALLAYARSIADSTDAPSRTPALIELRGGSMSGQRLTPPVCSRAFIVPHTEEHYAATEPETLTVDGAMIWAITTSDPPDGPVLEEIMRGSLLR